MFFMFCQIHTICRFCLAHVHADLLRLKKSVGLALFRFFEIGVVPVDVRSEHDVDCRESCRAADGQKSSNRHLSGASMQLNAECTQGWSKLAKGVQRGKDRWSYHPNELQFMFVTAAQVSYSNLALFMLVDCVEAEKYLNAIVAVSE